MNYGNGSSRIIRKKRNSSMEIKRTFDTRDYDVHESGHIELSGMTWEEYTEWALQQEDNVNE